MQTGKRMLFWGDEAFRRWWFRMGEIFGKPWFAKHGPEAPALWRDALATLTLERGAEILTHYAHHGDDSPPNLGQVMQVSREIGNRAQPTHRALPAPKADAEAVASHVEKLRAKTGMRRNIFRPGEGYTDYLAALQASGKRLAEFDAERLVQCGWTPEHESEYRRHAAVCGFRC